MLLACDPYCQFSAHQGWRETEERFVAWVGAQSNPKARWRQKAERLRALHSSEDGSLADS